MCAIPTPICRLQVSELDAGDGPVAVRGLVLARIAPNQDSHYGDILRLRGRLETPPSNEDFSYRDYLARQGIRSYMPIRRGHAAAGTGRQSSLAGWSTPGRKCRCRTSTACSSTRRPRCWPASCWVSIPAFRRGSSRPSTIRAPRTSSPSPASTSPSSPASSRSSSTGCSGARARGCWQPDCRHLFLHGLRRRGSAGRARRAHGLIGLLAVQVGRRQVGVNTLAAVAALMALFNPLILWDVGFQLSLLATLG